MTEAQRPGDGLSRPVSPARDEPDAHGQAALLLAESMLHLLVESGTLTRDQAVDTVRTAGSVKRERAAAAGESDTRMRESLGLLHRIELSFATIDPN